jgi:hypothetical protein
VVSEEDREHKEHQRRRAAAHEQAAAVHEQAAETHESAGAFFDEHNKPVAAERERGLADSEAGEAAAARTRAAVEED